MAKIINSIVNLCKITLFTFVFILKYEKTMVLRELFFAIVNVFSFQLRNPRSEISILSVIECWKIFAGCIPLLILNCSYYSHGFELDQIGFELARPITPLPSTVPLGLTFSPNPKWKES